MDSGTGALQFNSHFLNQVLYHCIQNTKFLSKVRSKLDVSLFKTKERIRLIQLIFDHFDEYKTAPQSDLYNIYENIEDSLSSDLRDRILSLIGILKDIGDSNSDYILNKIDDAIIHYQMENASIEFATLVKKGDYPKARNLMRDALRPPSDSNDVYDFFQDTSYIGDRLKEDRYRMITRIKKLDEIIKGLRTSWLINVLGTTKSGKTQFFIELTISALLQSLNVLYISLEMAKEIIDERFDMAMGFMSSEENPNKPIDTMKKVNGIWIKSKEIVPTIYNIEQVSKNRERFQKIGGGKLKIVAFNRGRLNWIDVGNIIDDLEDTGFYTHLLVVDYLGIMKELFAGQNKKDRISDNCLGIKEICGKKRLIGLSGMQGNRKAMASPVFHSSMVADDIDTIFHSDLILAICQTEAEEKENKSRIHIANFRHGKQKGMVGLIRDFSIGQFALDSYDPNDPNYQPKMTTANEEETGGIY